MVDMIRVRGDEIVHVGGDACGDRMTPQTHLVEFEEGVSEKWYERMCVKEVVEEGVWKCKRGTK